MPKGKKLSDYEKNRRTTESNRKLWLTVYAMTATLILMGAGKIPPDIFKDMFLGSLFVYSCANVAGKYFTK